MATPISELLVKIGADSSGLEEGLKKAGKSTDDFVSSVGEAIAQLGIAWKTMEAITAGINYNAMAEQAQVAFSTMLGSAEEAQALIEEMVDFAAKTPFDFPGVRDAGKQLLAFGIDAGKIIPTLRMLGDVGAGIGAPIGDLAYLFGTIATQGKAMTQDLNQFANRGIPIWDELAKIVGATGTDLRKMVEQGKIGFPEIEKAFQNMSGEGGKFFNLMENQSKTFSGAMSNMGDSLGKLGGSMTEGLMGPLEGVVRGITTLTEVANAMPSTMKNAVASLALVGAGFLTLIPTLKLFGVTMSVSTAGPIGALTASIGLLIIELTKLQNQFDEQKARVSTFQEIDARIKDGTASLADYQKAIRIVGEDLRKFEAARSSGNIIDSALNLTGQLDARIQKYTQRQRELLAVETRLRAEQEQRSKQAAEASRIQVDIQAQAQAAADKAIETVTRQMTVTQRAAEEKAKADTVQIQNQETIIDLVETEKVAVIDATAQAVEVQTQASETIVQVTENEVEQKKDLQKDYYAEMQSVASAAFQVLGALDEELGLGMGETLKNLETLSGGVMKLFQTGGMDPAAWAQTIVGAIKLIGQAFDALSGEEAKRAEEARRKEAKAIEDAARDRLATKIELLERERIEEISKAIATGAQTRDIEIYYARAIARAKLEANESILAEQRRIESESDRIRVSAYDKAIAQNAATVEALRKAQDERAKLAGNTLYMVLNRSGWDNAMSAINSQIESYKRILNESANSIATAEIEALEMSLALFGDRAESASKGLADAFIGGFTSGESEEEIKGAIFEMLQTMAVQAAIMASGLGQRFEEIGANIAQALADGFIDNTELANIEGQIDRLYSSASQVINATMGAFNTEGNGQAFASSGVQITINSPTAVDPAEASRILTTTMQQLSFQGVM